MKRTYNNIEKYKFICKDIGLFCEDILGIKLKPYQKIWLKFYGDIDNKGIIPLARRGKTFFYIIIYIKCYLKMIITKNKKQTNFKIRKLTPKECWRLMGFTDEQFDKAKESGISDSQLYKQAGNSIVVTVLEEIFKMLIKAEIIGR